MNPVILNAIGKEPRDWKMKAEVLRRRLVDLNLVKEESDDLRPEAYEDQQFEDWLLNLKEALQPFTA